MAGTAFIRFRSPRPQALSLGTYNIHYVRGFGIAQAIRVVQNGGFGLMVMMEINITNQAYFRNRLGYDMVCSTEIMTAAGGGRRAGGGGLVVQY